MSENVDGRQSEQLEKVNFNPPNTVTFKPEPTRQKITFEITNNESTDIAVKWKSTRPGTYHMCPTYALIKPGDSATTELICKGTVRDTCPTRDRFSIVYVAVTSSDVDARAIWKNEETFKRVTIGKVHKKAIFILYAGVNDSAEESKKLEMLGEEDAKIGVVVDDLKTTRTAGNFTCLMIPIDSAHPMIAVSPDLETAKPEAL